jgi:AcrR family transcriptional regulator
VSDSDIVLTSGSRRYTSARRERQAEQTRTDVLMAATRLFAARGYAGTTLAGIAVAADVAVETVYAGFGSKKALLGAAMDVAIVGDTAPVPLFERPEAHRIEALPPGERMPALFAWVGRVYSGPVAGVWQAMLEAAANDPEVAGWCVEHERRRRSTLVDWLAANLDTLPQDAVIDQMWAITSMEVFGKLTRERGWSVEQWARWMVDAMRLLAPDLPR